MGSMDIQLSKRIPRPRIVLSPDDNSYRPTHFLLHFDSTDSYNIALYSSLKNVSGDKATLHINGKKTIATIITSGTLETCEKEQQRITRASQQSANDNDRLNVPNNDVENEDITSLSAYQKKDLIRTKSSSNYEHTLNDKHLDCDPSDEEDFDSLSDIDRNDEESPIGLDRSIALNGGLGKKHQMKLVKRKRKQVSTNNTTSKRQRTGVIHSGETQPGISGGNPIVSDQTNSKEVLNQIENRIALYQNMMKKALKRMERKFDQHIGSHFIQGSKILDQYRTESGEVYPTEYKYLNKNLLMTPAKDMLDFARKTMKILFSTEELQTHILPPARDHLRRPALDQERFSILIETIRIKFRLDNDLMQQCFNDLLRSKLSNFMYEERRREARRKVREREKNLLKASTVQLPQFDHQDSVNRHDE